MLAFTLASLPPKFAELREAQETGGSRAGATQPDQGATGPIFETLGFPHLAYERLLTTDEIELDDGYLLLAGALAETKAQLR